MGSLTITNVDFQKTTQGVTAAIKGRLPNPAHKYNGPHVNISGQRITIDFNVYSPEVSTGPVKYVRCYANLGRLSPGHYEVIVQGKAFKLSV